MTSELLRAVRTHPDAGTHVDQLVATSRRHGLSAAQTAYVLALAHHESRLGLRLVDPASGWGFEGRAELGNTEEGDGPRFRGRGYVPIVGRRAYSQWAQHLDLPLVDCPELVQVPDVAADILVQGITYGRFTGRSLPEFVNDARADYVGARRTVPRRDRAGVGPLGRAVGEHTAGLAIDVADPVLSGEEAAALGLFATIGTRDGRAVHLGVTSGHDGPDAHLPLSAGGPPATRQFALG